MKSLLSESVAHKSLNEINYQQSSKQESNSKDRIKAADRKRELISKIAANIYGIKLSPRYPSISYEQDMKVTTKARKLAEKYEVTLSRRMHEKEKEMKKLGTSKELVARLSPKQKQDDNILNSISNIEILGTEPAIPTMPEPIKESKSPKSVQGKQTSVENAGAPKSLYAQRQIRGRVMAKEYHNWRRKWDGKDKGFDITMDRSGLTQTGNRTASMDFGLSGKMQRRDVHDSKATTVGGDRKFIRLERNEFHSFQASNAGVVGCKANPFLSVASTPITSTDPFKYSQGKPSKLDKILRTSTERDAHEGIKVEDCFERAGIVTPKKQEEDLARSLKSSNSGKRSTSNGIASPTVIRKQLHAYRSKYKTEADVPSSNNITALDAKHTLQQLSNSLLSPLPHLQNIATSSHSQNAAQTAHPAQADAPSYPLHSFFPIKHPQTPHDSYKEARGRSGKKRFEVMEQMLMNTRRRSSYEKKMICDHKVSMHAEARRGERTPVLAFMLRGRIAYHPT